MAILGKIRERSLFLIIVIALALFSFVIGDVFTRGSFGGSSNSIGEVNGENISREEFIKLVDRTKAQNQNRGSQMQSVNAAWNSLLQEKIYKIQLEKSGITVGEKDVWDEIIKQPFAQNNPEYKNEAGLFDEDKFKEYIATIKDAKDDDEQSRQAWLSWREYEDNVKKSLELRAYNNLITAGLGATLKEGERHYVDNNTKLDLEYVFVPFTSIPDSTITVTDDEILAYAKKHPNDYKAEASRDISFVKFDINATSEDEQVIKNNLQKLINNSEEYNKAAKSNMTVVGFANTENVEDFFRDHKSDTPLNNNFVTKSKINKIIADTIFNSTIGDVYGPYKEANYFKLSKLVAVKQMPDSVKARHILIPFLGTSNDPSNTLTEEQAKKMADSLLIIVKEDNSKFADLAKTISSDKGSGAKGGDLDWFTYERMVPEFRDYSFENKVGDIGVVKSQFGFHIIDIQEQKNLQKSVKLATFSREIIPSEETENAIYQEAETFASQISEGKKFEDLAKDQKLTIQPVEGLKAMDERVSSLGNQRQIITWAFNKDSKVNNIKRFDIEKGYAVVKLTAKNEKGLNLGTAKSLIKTKLLNEKKSNLIKEKIKGDNLQDIAKIFNSKVQSSRAVSIGSPILTDAGRSEDIITTLITLPEGKLYKAINSTNGVFSVKILKKDSPKPLENYTSSKNTVWNLNKSKGSRVYNALKKVTTIKDNRAAFY